LNPEGCTGLTIAGGALEIAGFGLVAWELARIQRREFGEPEFVRRLRARLRKLFGRPRRVAELSATLSAEGTLRASGRVRARPGDDTLEERVQALEKNFGYLEDELDHYHTSLEKGLDDLRKKLDDMQAELDRERREREEERKASLRTSVTLQAWGTGLFVLGTILSVLGNTVNC
jgi:hypothetical protein